MQCKKKVQGFIYHIQLKIVEKQHFDDNDKLNLMPLVKKPWNRDIFTIFIWELGRTATVILKLNYSHPNFISVTSLLYFVFHKALNVFNV